MINLPYNSNLPSRSMACQNVPIQTSQNNFQPFHQPQTIGQYMQPPPYGIFPGSPQDLHRQVPLYQCYQPGVSNVPPQYPANISAAKNTYQPVFQQPFVLPPTETNPTNHGILPQNILEQIRACVGNASPIFILPSSCHQSNSHQQPSTTSPTSQGSGFNYPPSIHCPPSFYPYPIPMPIYEPFASQTRAKEKIPSCACCQRKNTGSYQQLSCCCNNEPEEHRCTETMDDTVCSKRNCPSSISLQALASQLLAVSGVIPCAATRLLLRKIPGSNITTSMEDTMDRAQRSISILTKEQLLTESRNAQHVNGLINLHMTTNPPANIIPALTLVQLKVNLLKAQVDAFINKKIMENEGYAVEVETTCAIDPSFLAMKSDSELRQLLSALQRKECEERNNVNFAPYHSQRAVAESRLNIILNKIRQVEAEFDRRRYNALPPPPTLTSRIIQQFSESYAYGPPPGKLFQHHLPYQESPSPFPITVRSPRRLNLQPHVGSPETTYGSTKATDTSDNVTPEVSKDGEEKKEERRCSNEDCTCTPKSSSNESLEEDKKKLRLKIDGEGNVRITSAGKLQDVSLFKIPGNVSPVINAGKVIVEEEVDGAADKKIYRSSVHVEVQAPAEPVKLDTMTKQREDNIDKDEDENRLPVKVEMVESSNSEKAEAVSAKDVDATPDPTENGEPVLFATSFQIALKPTKTAGRKMDQGTSANAEISGVKDSARGTKGGRHDTVMMMTNIKYDNRYHDKYDDKNSRRYSDDKLSMDWKKMADLNTSKDSLIKMKYSKSDSAKTSLMSIDKVIDNNKCAVNNSWNTSHNTIDDDHYTRKSLESVIEVMNDNNSSTNNSLRSIDGNISDNNSTSKSLRSMEKAIDDNPGSMSSSINGVPNKIDSPRNSEKLNKLEEYKISRVNEVPENVDGDEYFVKKSARFYWKSEYKDLEIERLAKTEECGSTTKLSETQSARDEISVGEKEEHSFLPREILSNDSETIRDLSSYQETGKNLVSVISSAIGGLSSFTSFLNNVKALQSIVPKLSSNPLSESNSADKNPGTNSYYRIPREMRVKEKQDNKEVLQSSIIENSKNTSFSYANFSNSNNKKLNQDEYNNRSNKFATDSVDKGCSDNLHQINRSIIVDKENFGVLTGSFGEQQRELKKYGFKHPYKVRRSLLISSRLKDPAKDEGEDLSPFTILKKSGEEIEGKYKLSAGKKLPVLIEESEENLNLSGSAISGNQFRVSSDNLLPGILHDVRTDESITSIATQKSTMK